MNNSYVFSYNFGQCYLRYSATMTGNHAPPFFIILSGVGLSPLGTAATTGLLYQP
jgi:hypothetical protein